MAIINELKERKGAPAIIGQGHFLFVLALRMFHRKNTHLSVVNRQVEKRIGIYGDEDREYMNISCTDTKWVLNDMFMDF